MNIKYLIPRIIRHFLPDAIVRTLLDRNILIRKGLESVNPNAAIRRYLDAIGNGEDRIVGKRVLVLGYGGNLAVGCGLLKAGADHVVLCDPFARADHRRNRRLLPRFDAYLRRDGRRVVPRPEFITLIHEDICKPSVQLRSASVDAVFSNTVYEHLENVEAVTMALATVCSDDGLQVHLIDLRDHYFKYPFEMLCYTEAAWRRWLDPSSHHNRYRLPDFQQVFDRYFEEVEITVLARDEAAFEKARKRIRPEFLTGDADIDSITRIKVQAKVPRRAAIDLTSAARH